MLRLLPLVALALVPAVAAPVPVDAARAEFGRAGLLTRADLNRVRFDSRRSPEGAWEAKFGRVKEVNEPGRDDRARPANRFDVAVHLPRTTFRAGDPAPAYFVLRNNRGHDFALHSRLDLCRPEPLLHGTGYRSDVRDRATGRSVVEGLSATSHCGGGVLVEVPGDGFYCARVELNWLAGRVLPPGEYEVDWRYRELAAAPVPFAVLPREDGRKPTLAPRPTLRFLHLTEDADEEPAERDAPRPRGPVVWGNADLEPVHADDLAAALAVGPDGVFVPDLHAVPAADRLVDAHLEWKPYRDGDRVAVTLRAAAPNAEVRFDELPQFYVQLETAARASDGFELQALERKRRATRDRERLVTPLTVEARMPVGWREQVGASGAARLSVLVVSRELELPSARAREKQKLIDKAERAAGSGVPVWSGVVRTPATDIHLPPPLSPAVR